MTKPGWQSPPDFQTGGGGGGGAIAVEVLETTGILGAFLMFPVFLLFPTLPLFIVFPVFLILLGFPLLQLFLYSIPKIPSIPGGPATYKFYH